MACVIRVKRRVDEDPAEVLFLSCKRPREEDHLQRQSVLTFAGTISSKNEPVSSHIKDAIRRKKLHKEQRPQGADFKHSSHLPEVTSKLREETVQSSRANRYRVTMSRRALDLELLDKEIDYRDSEVGEKSDDSLEYPLSLSGVKCEKDVNDSCTENKKQKVTESKKDNPISTINSVNISKDLSNDRVLQPDSVTIKTGQLSGSSAANDARPLVKEDKIFCMLDVENDMDEPVKGCDQQSASGITLNNVLMQSSRATTPPLPEFVYDLYYTHNNLSDLDKEAVLTVEALCNELVYEKEDESLERDCVYDDEDDSNDENNWRADYPDEDPRFFENADEDFHYAEDMVDTNFLRDDDTGDLLAYWMDTRCKFDIVSDDGEDEYEGDKGDSSESSDE